MGWNRLIHDYDWAGDEQMLRRALEIQPNHSGALHWLSHVLSWQGKHEEALAVARKAVAVDPLSRLMKMNLAYIMVDAGDFARGIPLARTTIERNPNFVSQMRNRTLHELRACDIKSGSMCLEAWAAAEGRDVAPGLSASCSFNMSEVGSRRKYPLSS